MIETATLAWVIALGMGAAAAALFARLRSMSVELNEAKISAEKLAGELHASRAQLEREAAKQRRKGDELADLRKRHDKLKKRKGSDGRNASQSGAAAGNAADDRIGGTANERAVEEIRQERNRARAESSALSKELDAARASIAAGKPVEGTISPDAAQALRDDCKHATDALDGLRNKTMKAEDQVARLKKKLESHEMAYVQLRGELEAKKDRLMTQSEELERLRAFKVALVDAADGDFVAAASDSFDTDTDTDTEPDTES